MPDFYARLIVTAQRILASRGREVTLVSFNETPQNAAQPWKGPVDARGTPAAQLVVNAAFVPPSSQILLGLDTVVTDLLKRSEQICIVAPGATADLKIYQSISDGGQFWTIDEINELKPGNSVVLGFIGVSR